MQVLRLVGYMRWVIHNLPPKSRVVCLSDIHGNRAALEAVLTHAHVDDADLVVMHGDLVNRGPCPAEVWDRLAGDPRRVLLSGNHERYVRSQLIPGAAPTGRLAEVHSTSAWTCQQLGHRALQLTDWPEGMILRCEGLPEARVVHASLIGDEQGVSPESPKDYQKKAAEGPWSLLIVGHLHRNYDFWVGNTRVVNAGSVGSACDGVRLAGWVELRASARGWLVDVHRIPYDYQRTDDDYHQSGFLRDAGPTAQLVYREWQLARPVVRPWFNRYIDSVLGDTISLERAVSDYLKELR